MRPTVLITGAAGYIGGAIVADLVASNTALVKREDIYAAVRSDEQARALSKLDVNVLQIDLADGKAVLESIRRCNVNIVIHTASSILPGLALNLITALGEQKKATGEEAYFIHTSALSAFSPKTGWSSEPTRDTGPVYAQEQALAGSYPVRETDVAVIEHAKASGVTSFIVVPPLVYGRGAGAWNQLSVVLPVYVQAFIKVKKVYKFANSVDISGVHISDITVLYTLLIHSIVQRKDIPNGDRGYYFALAHKLHWPKVLNRLAEALKARNLVADTTVDVWPSDAVAAEALNVPLQFLQVLWNAGENIISTNVNSVGWVPTYDGDRFLRSMDEEVEDVLELGQAKSSLIASLFEHANK